MPGDRRKSVRMRGRVASNLPEQRRDRGGSPGGAICGGGPHDGRQTDCGGSRHFRVAVGPVGLHAGEDASRRDRLRHARRSGATRCEKRHDTCRLGWAARSSRASCQMLQVARAATTTTATASTARVVKKYRSIEATTMRHSQKVVLTGRPRPRRRLGGGGQRPPRRRAVAADLPFPPLRPPPRPAAARPPLPSGPPAAPLSRRDVPRRTPSLAPDPGASRPGSVRSRARRPAARRQITDDGRTVHVGSTNKVCLCWKWKHVNLIEIT